MLGVRDLHELMVVSGWSRGMVPMVGLLQKLLARLETRQGECWGGPTPAKKRTSNGRRADGSTVEVRATSGRRP